MKNDVILHNIFFVFFNGDILSESDKKNISRVLSYLKISIDEYKKLYSRWSTNKTFIIDNNPAEQLESLVFMIYAAYLKGWSSSENIVKLKNFAQMINLDFQKVQNFFDNNMQIDSSNIEESLKTIRSHFNGTDRVKKTSPSQKKKESTYAATQITREGIDELQAIALCYFLGLNVALDGPPGIGKTQSVIDFSEIFGLRLFTKICSNRTTESHIISHPILSEQNGVSITDHANGPLTQAMITPGIFYGDEYNLLKEDVQKRMNSAFDDRRSIDRNDGAVIKALPGFFPVISYNPSSSMKDLEESVADRFVHFTYKEWPGDLRAYISLKKADPEQDISYSDFGIVLEERGMSTSGDFYLKVKDGNESYWIDFFSKKKMDFKRPEFVYLCHKIKNFNDDDIAKNQTIKNLSEGCYSQIELSRLFARFTELINDLALTGKSPMLTKLGLDEMNKKDDLELLEVHKCSTRIISAALKHYNYFLNKGWNIYLAQSYSTGLIINQMCYGSYRKAKLRDSYNYDIITKIASAFSLYKGANALNTKFIRSSLL